MINANKKRLRRTMMFLNAQKPGLIKDPYIYKPDSIMLDLEDAVPPSIQTKTPEIFGDLRRLFWGIRGFRSGFFLQQPHDIRKELLKEHRCRDKRHEEPGERRELHAD